MRSKYVTGLLALFFGSTGAHRFYLSENRKGFTFLLIFWVIFPGLIWAVQNFFLAEYWLGLLWLWRVSIGVVHIEEAIRFFVMSREKFATISKGSKQNAFPIIAIVAAGILGYGTTMVLKEKKIDISKAEPAFTVSSAQFDEEFRTSQKNDGEKSFNAKYLKKVIILQGEITNVGTDFEEGSFIELKGASEDPHDIKCTFYPENVSMVDKVAAGYIVSVKGQCDGNKLYNCYILGSKENESSAGDVRSSGDSIIVK